MKQIAQGKISTAKKHSSLLLLFLVLILTGCGGDGGKKVDSSTLEQFNKTMQEAKESLGSDEEKRLFDRAIEAQAADLAKDSVKIGMDLGAKNPNDPKLKEKIQKKVEARVKEMQQHFHGMTATQIVEEGRKVKGDPTKDAQEDVKDMVKEKYQTQ